MFDQDVIARLNAMIIIIEETKLFGGLPLQTLKDAKEEIVHLRLQLNAIQNNYSEIYRNMHKAG